MPRSNKLESPGGLKKLALAAEAGKRGNYPLAVKILRELISETDAPAEAWLLLGRSLHALKNYSPALAAFNDYIRQKPRLAEGYFFAGRTYITIGMPYKAVPFLRKAVILCKTTDKNPGKTSGLTPMEFRAKTRALLGTAYLKSRHSQAAVEIFEEAVQEDPDDKRIYRAYLNSLFVRGIRLCGAYNYELGLQMLRFVLENREEAGMDDSPLLRLELGRAARETGNLEEAYEHFTAALKIAGEDRRIRWSRASILMALGKTAEAVKEIDRIRSRDKGVPELPWNSELVDLFMIQAFLSEGQWRRAAESCRVWLRAAEGKDQLPNNPPRSMIHVIFAEALRNMGNFQAAHNHLQRALEDNPKELDFWYADILISWEGKDYKSAKKAIRMANNLGGDKELLKRFDVLCRALTSIDSFGNITLLQNAIRQLGPDPELMNALGEAYLKVGLLEEAESWFTKTVTVKNEHEKAWLGRIASVEALLALGGRGKSEELSSLYKAYLEIWPTNAAIRRDRALFLVRTFEYAEAAMELEKLLVLEPSNHSLRRVLAYTYRKTGRYREAAVFLKALLKEKPRDIELLIELCGCLERAGAVPYSFTLLEKARELFSASGDISLALGILHYRQKNIEKAYDFFREAAALNPGDPRPYEWMANIARKNGEQDPGRYEKEAKIRKNNQKNRK